MAVPPPRRNGWRRLLGFNLLSATVLAIVGFEIGQLISHTAFGLGVVTGARDNIKIDIMFPDGTKVLQQGC